MDLYVNRTDLHRTQVVDRPAEALDPGQARLRIERFGLSANNITYAVIGDMLHYWDFFPADEGWGRVPVWGYATVVESRHDGVATGTRVFGFLPMSDELVITVGRVDARSITDAAPHRSPMAAAYNRYTLAPPGGEGGSAAEDQRMLLYPLFFTSFLVDDFLADNPGTRCTRSKDYRSSPHHPLVWCSIRFAFGDGHTSIMSPIIELDADNRFRRVVVFWGAPPADFD